MLVAIEQLHDSKHAFTALATITSLNTHNVIQQLADASSPVPLTDLCEARHPYRAVQLTTGHVSVGLNLLHSMRWVAVTDAGYMLTTDGHDLLHLSGRSFRGCFDGNSGSLPPETHDNPPGVSHEEWIRVPPNLQQLVHAAYITPLLAKIFNEQLYQQNRIVNNFPLCSRLWVFSKLQKFGWLDLSCRADDLEWTVTNIGHTAFRTAALPALSDSYRPMLRNLTNSMVHKQVSTHTEVQTYAPCNLGADEVHVDRSMNVRASGSHNAFFTYMMMQHIMRLFDNEQFEDQPRYVVDTGCGDGALLAQIYSTICKQTRRGLHLQEYPLLLIGVDYNRAALHETTKTLTSLCMPFKTMWGDIGDPARIVSDLAGILGLLDVENALHVRSFLDHNRPFLTSVPDESTTVLDAVGWRSCIAYGQHVHENGCMIPVDTSRADLRDHLRKWAAVPTKFGLLISEVHRVPAQLAVSREDGTISDAVWFDALHGYSHQYLVTAADWLLAAAEVGLMPVTVNSLPSRSANNTVRFTLTHFQTRPYTVYRLTPDGCCPIDSGFVERIVVDGRTAQQCIMHEQRNYPGMQFVLHQKDQQHVDAVIFCSRNDSMIKVCDKSAGIDPHGMVYQLRKLHAQRGSGTSLLSFILQQASVTPGVEVIGGVSKCSGFEAATMASPGGLIHSDYIIQQTDCGQPIDPVLAMHSALGGVIGGHIPNFHDEDHGHGVVVTYNPVFIRNQRVMTIDTQADPVSTTADFDYDDVRDKVTSVLTDMLGQQPANDAKLVQTLGLDSEQALIFAGRMTRLLGMHISPTILYECDCIDDIVLGITRRGVTGKATESNASRDTSTQSVARLSIATDVRPVIETETDATQNQDVSIVGFNCVFPNAKNPEEFWKLLTRNRGCKPVPMEKERIPDSQQKGSLSLDHDRALYHLLPWKEVQNFDHQLFNMSKKEAYTMDPQQRILLQVVYHALERAGVAPAALKGSDTGVFVGQWGSDYGLLLGDDQDRWGVYGTNASTTAGRVSYSLGLHGPSMVVNTACSSSLVALHLAKNAIRNKECGLAIVAGVNLVLGSQTNNLLGKMHMLSPTNSCDTFGAKADGYVRSDGWGVVILASHTSMERLNLHSMAVVRGSAVNHDGYTSGFTVPSRQAQTHVYERALADANTPPVKVDIIEAHGSGTSIGDAIELESLATVYGKRNAPLIIGSCKSHIGHMESAAGMAGVIKILLCMENKTFTPHARTSANPLLEESMRLLCGEVLTCPREWSTRTIDGNRVAAVSSFGMTGTNAHVIIASASPAHRTIPSLNTNTSLMCCVSGYDHKCLALQIEGLCAWLKQTELQDIPPTMLAVATNMTHRRSHMSHRLAVVANSVTLLREALQKQGDEIRERIIGMGAVKKLRTDKPLVFVFSGQGSQYHGMGAGLYGTSILFKAFIDRCAQLLTPWLGLNISLYDILWGGQQQRDNGYLQHTRYTQVALFCVQVATIELYKSLGVKPSVVLGHSVGEYAAAYAAGMFTLEDGILIICKRADLMGALEELPLTKGCMQVLFTSEANVLEAIARLPTKSKALVSIAAVNSPSQVVISGEPTVMQMVYENCGPLSRPVVKLNTSNAFHSSFMDKILAPFEKFIADSVSVVAPNISIANNVTGALLPPGNIQMTSPTYWSQALRNTVRFADCVASVMNLHPTAVIELGAKPVFRTLFLHLVLNSGNNTDTALMPVRLTERDEQVTLMSNLAKLYEMGLYTPSYRTTNNSSADGPLFTFHSTTL
jgi:acyl transferase domain-containing protein